MRSFLLTILLALPFGRLHAQAPGTCEPATAETYLEGQNVRARILGNGSLFSRGDPYVYEVPKGHGLNAIFAAALWAGGYVGDSLRVAASTFGGYTFWPGPLLESGAPPADCAPYDRFWQISRDDIAVFELHGYPAPDLRDWPHHLGAPVLDGDGDPTNYDLAAGDRPALLGDEAVWWVMNDAGGIHSNGSLPIGLEARVMAYAFDVPGVLGRSTFYRYQLTYRGEVPFDSAHVALWADVELGYAMDDYVGADTALHVGYVYNGDDNDDTNTNFGAGYGPAPPALGIALLQGPRTLADGQDNDGDGTVDEAGERHGMTAFINPRRGGGPAGDPGVAQDYMHYMRGRWKDGAPLTVGGEGRDPGGTPTPFAYPGDPATGAFWSERNTDGDGASNFAYDRRMVVASGPFSMQPGETEEIVFAIVWSQGADYLDSVRQLREDVAFVRARRDALLTPREAVSNERDAPRPEATFSGPYPNPTAGSTRVAYRVPAPMPVRLSLHDALGREVAIIADGVHAAGAHAADLDVRGLAAGTYFLRLALHGTFTTRSLVVVR